MPYDFYQLTNSLLKTHPAANFPGTSLPFSSEFIQFKTNARLGFPVREVETCEFNNSKNTAMPPVSIMVNFMGIYGVTSPLPTHYSEEILYEGEQDSNVRHLLDMFNHRFISYLFRINDKYKYSMSLDNNSPDNISSCLLSFLGFDYLSVDQGHCLDWKRIIPMVGLIGITSGSAYLLEKLIPHYFRISFVSIKKTMKQKIPVCLSQKNSIGIKNSNLGKDISLGSNVYDGAGKFRVVIDKLTLSKYRELLPGRKSNIELKMLVNLVTSTALSYELELNIDNNELTQCYISKEANKQLGVDSWLGCCNGYNKKIIISN